MDHIRVMLLRLNNLLSSPDELQAMRKLKAYDITHEPNQFIKVTRLPAEPFMFMGNIWIKKPPVITMVFPFGASLQQCYLIIIIKILVLASDIITHGIAPMPNEKDPVNTWSQIAGTEKIS